MEEKNNIEESVENPNILPRNIEDEMKDSYIDYSMSVIIGRALPDVRDGLKPVHRRILFTMDEMGLVFNKAYKKSARVVGDVLGKYHPHGDSAVYDALVRMVQEFSLRYTLVDGQGNFGSVDGDPPAAMRYTEVRMDRITQEMLSDIDKNTVDFMTNYDGSLQEPQVLPAMLPNLLLNGSSGIAVGMATNIPPHNLTELVDAINAYIDDKEITTADLMKIIKGPDFPTGGTICGYNGIKNYFETGRGSVKIRAKAHIEDMRGGKQAIIVDELPYQVNKSSLLSTIAELVRDKRIEGISDLRDESNRDGIRVMIELKRDGNSQVILNQLYKHTQMEVSFGVIMLALVENKPKVLSLKEMMGHYIDHRCTIVRRRTQFDLNKAEERAHIVEGLRIAIDNLDRIINIIRESNDSETARKQLVNEFKLSFKQAHAILEMRLHQLTGLERKKLQDEYLDLIKTIEQLTSILADSRKILTIVREELANLKEKYGDARRTELAAEIQDLCMEDLIREEDVVVTLSHAGYVKRLPVTTYKSQRRGGRGVTGMSTREEDFIEDLFICTTHSYLLFFTNLGRVYWVKVYEIPEGGRTSKGKAVVNLLQLSQANEKITAAISVKDFEAQKDNFLLMMTAQGTIKKTNLDNFSNPRRGGIIAISLDENDKLIDVKLTNGKQGIIIATKEGAAIRFLEEDVRPIGRSGQGVRGIRLEKGDEVVGMEVVQPNESLLTVTENGFGKRSKVDLYREQSRGGKGVINIRATERNGKVVGIRRVKDEDDIVLMTMQGIVIRQPVKGISQIGRNTQGVRLVKLESNDKLAVIAYIVKEDEVIDEIEEKK
ncbi:MAG: DNA gyrase subunit A [bacterium]